MAKWQCGVCEHVYDPALGDPTQGVGPNTAFEDLPDDWVCPDCGALQEMFDKLDG